MSRADELKKLCENIDGAAKVATDQLVDEIIFIEDQLKELRRYPFIAVNPKNPQQQRPTPAAKQYKEMLQQYSGCIKILLSVIDNDGSKETSPLREYLNAMKAGGLELR